MIKHLNFNNFNGVKIKGYTNTWSSLESTTHKNNVYHLLENDEYGDETCYLLVNDELDVMGETFDDIDTAIADWLE